jgi:hypothetical protein
VFVGLWLLSLPLRMLTSASAPAEVQAAAPVHAAEIPMVFRIKLLSAAAHLALAGPHGNPLLDMKNPEAGESDHELSASLVDGELHLHLTADFADSPGETAVFVTVAPDGLEEKTLYATGSGRLEETLMFEWPEAQPHE